MAPKKYYGVAVGRQPGVYDNWPAAQAQVKGFPGAKFKSFTSRGEVDAWLLDPVYESGGNPKKTRDKAAAIDISPKAGEITVFTDGGSINNPGPGGYGIVIIEDGIENELSGGYQHTTNNRMELMGVIVALKTLGGRKKPITIYSDSSYVVNGINKGWAKSWRRNGWIKSDRNPAVNADLWASLLDLIGGLKTTFIWVKGHAGHHYNERCDKLAVAAAKSGSLPVDRGYKPC